MFVSYECVHCVSYLIQGEALKLRCTGQVSYCTIQIGKFGPILERKIRKMWAHWWAFATHIHIHIHIHICIYTYIYIYICVCFDVCDKNETNISQANACIAQLGMM